MPQPPPSPHTYKTYALAVFFLVASWTAFTAFTADQRRAGAWGCEMSWMMPSYREIAWPGRPEPKYGLYLYREEGVDRAEPAGHPVIFVPGNAGSYKQVRSIASSASRQLREGVRGRALDFFTLDLGEDFSAFHAGTLERQAASLAASVERVLAAYSQRPAHVTLLGHSMGGIVARLAAASLDPGLVDVILTMSTPHLAPPVTLEWGMQRVYEAIAMPVAPLVSICGGVSDTQVVSDDCALPPGFDGFAVFSTGIPGAWTGVEHQAMVWCHQIRWRVARALLAMEGEPSSQLDLARLWLGDGVAVDAFRDHVVGVVVTHRSMAITFALDGLTEATLAAPPVRVEHCDGACSAVDSTILAFPRPNPGQPFPLSGEGARLDEVGFVVTVDLPWREGIVKLSSALPILEVAGGAHQVQAGAFEPVGRTIRIDLSFDRSASSLDVWRLITEQALCTGLPPVIQHRSVPAARLNGTTESRFYLAGAVGLHSHISGSPSHRDAAHRLDVSIIQSEDCPVTSVSLAYDWQASLAKVVLRYRMAAVAWPTGWAAWVVARQMRSFAAAGTAPSFPATLEQSLGTALAQPAGLIAATSLLQLVPIPWTHLLLLGTTNTRHLVWIALIAVWSLAAVCALSVAGQLIGKLRRPSATADTSLAWRLGSAAVFLAVTWLFLPHQMAIIVLFLVQLVAVLTDTKSRISGSLLLLLGLLLPFHLPGLAVWGRDFWHGAVRLDRSIFEVVPALAAVEAASRREPMQRRAPFVQAAALVLACAAFLIGIRWTFALQPLLHLVLVAVAVLFV